METKNKLLRKIMALGLAGVMMLGMSTVAFAAAGTTASSGNDTTFTIDKVVVIDNDGSAANVFGPTITYTYSIAGTAETNPKTTVTDGTTTTNIQTGPAGGVLLNNNASSASIALTSHSIASADFATGYKGNITVSFDINKFSKPGVYRYTITDTTTDAALAEAGIQRDANVIDDHYLTVFVGYTSATDNTLVIKGYSLTVDNEDLDTSTGKETSFETKKNTQTDPNEDPVYENADPDTYHTYNVKVTKTVTGTMGDKNFQFSFAVPVANNGYKFYSGKVAASLAETEQGSLSTTLADGEEFIIEGLSAKATVNATETNNSNDTYKVSVVAGSTTVAAAAKGVNETTAAFTEAKAVTNWATVNATAPNTTPTKDGDTTTIAYTNNLEEISPTGVVLRFAPYIMMMAGAIALVMFTRRRKAEEK